MGYQPRPQESAYGGGASVPLQNPSSPAQTSLPIQAQPAGGNTQPVMSPPQYQPPEMQMPPTKGPAYPRPDVSQVPGPSIPKMGQEQDSSIFNNIGKQTFPGSEGGPGRFSNPYKPSVPMKGVTFEGGGYQGGGYQPQQFEGMRGRLAQYSQYVRKNPFRGQE